MSRGFLVARLQPSGEKVKLHNGECLTGERATIEVYDGDDFVCLLGGPDLAPQDAFSVVAYLAPMGHVSESRGRPPWLA